MQRQLMAAVLYVHRLTRSSLMLHLTPQEFKAAPGSKQEKNKPKGGKAKDEKRAADKAKQAAKQAALY